MNLPGRMSTIFIVTPPPRSRANSAGAAGVLLPTDGAGAAAAVRIFPAIVVQNATITGDLGLNNANATVSAAPANLAVVTFLGAASTGFVQRAVMGRGVGRVISATLDDLPSGENASRKLKSVPLTMRAHRFSNGNNGVCITRFDAPYQFNTEAFGRFKVCRING
jgi:hypothetical protein